MKNKKYLRFVVKAEPEKCEWITGRMSILPFESFEETNDGLFIYLPEAEWTTDLKAEVRDIEHYFNVKFKVEPVENKNWNALWEAGFSPVTIGEFCHIRASFHPPGPPVEYELVIDPRMAFGTGHHQTTSMVVEAMEQISFYDKKVLDFGCGTGILAILAAMKGSTDVTAIDNDPNAVENTQDNCQLNGCPSIRILEGGLEVLFPDESYDIILANINRNVLLESMASLYDKLGKNGILIISGFVKGDLSVMSTSLTSCGFHLQSVRESGEWLCLHLNKAKEKL